MRNISALAPSLTRRQLALSPEIFQTLKQNKI